MKIFFDIGAGNGGSLQYFKKHNPNFFEFMIYCFEPVKSNVDLLKQYVEENKFRNVVVLPEAAWVCDGIETFYPGTSWKSGTFYPNKTTGGITSKDSMKVRTTDIAKFISQECFSTDQIWMKINAEGAEYQIIEHLHSHNLISWIDRWYVNWHVKKIPGMEKIHNRVISLIPEAKPWRIKKNYLSEVI